MNEPKLAYTDDEFIITFSRGLHDSRPDRAMLAAIAQSLSIEGLQEATEYFASQAATRKKPGPLALAIDAGQPATAGS